MTALEGFSAKSHAFRATAHAEPEARRGAMVVAPDAALAAVGRELARGGLLVASVDEARVRPGVPLRLAIDEAVEAMLAFRGAIPPAVPFDAKLEVSIVDQLKRARMLGAAGLGLVLPALAQLADGRGRLGDDDGATFLGWMAAAKRHPITLALGESSQRVSVLAPVSLGALARQMTPAVPVARAEPQAAPPAPAPVLGEAPPEAPPATAQVALASETVPAQGQAEPSTSARHRAEPAAPAESQPTAEASGPIGAEAADVRMVDVDDHAELDEPEEDLGEEADDAHEDAATHAHDQGPDEALLRAAMRRALEGAPAGSDSPRLAPSRVPPPLPGLASRAAAVRPPEPRPSEPRASGPDPLVRRKQREKLLAAIAPTLGELEEARGPKPARALEQLFANRYVPALELDCDGPREVALSRAVASFRESFAHSYTEGFQAIRVTGKRPSMVFDAPEVAGRIARLNGARQTHLVLVDAMSASVGDRVLARLRARAQGTAVCVERVTLWSALPTNTAMQMTLLAKGMEGLRDGATPSERDPGINRGRAVSTLRRERVGSRDLLKLDLVEARLRERGPSFVTRVDAVADEVSEVLAKHLETLSPRTLCFVFGDHGFRLEPSSPDGLETGPATYGGASPEEVLVPGFAMLVGGVH